MSFRLFERARISGVRGADSRETGGWCLPECLEGFVLLEAGRKVFDSLAIKVVVPETANKGGIGDVSRGADYRVGADSRKTGVRRRT